MKILACIMYKNEEEVLRRCVESISNLVDGYLLVDTGSTDASDQVLHDYLSQTNKQFFYDRIEFINFVDSKNEVLRKAREYTDYDFVMWMDADEYFQKEQVDLLLSKIQSANFPFDMIVTDIQDFHNNIPTLRYERPRIWKNGSFFFEGPGVHEYIVNSQFSLHARDVIVHHSHKTKNKTYNTSLYISLLKQHLEKEPQNKRALFYLTRTYYDRFFINKNNEEDFAFFQHYTYLYRKAVEKDTSNLFLEEYWYTYYQQGLIYKTKENLKEAERCFKKCIALLPKRIEGYRYLAETYLDMKDSKSAMLTLEPVIFLNEQEQFILFTQPFENISLCHLLFNIYWDNYKFQKAIRLLIHILEHKDYNAYDSSGSLRDSFDYFNTRTFKVNKYDINNFFKKIVYINLDSRKDRREKIENNLEAAGVYKAERVAGIDGKYLCIDSQENSPVKRTPGYYGCFLTHFKIIKEAYETGLENILILEDDVAVHKNLDWEFNKIMNFINVNLLYWDVLYLGHVNYNEHYSIGEEDSTWTINKKKNSPAIYAHNVWGCHAYALNRNAMKEIISYYEENGIHYELDRVLAGVLKDKLKYLAVYPELFVQYDTKSDTSNTDIERNNHFNNSVNKYHSSIINYNI